MYFGGMGLLWAKGNWDPVGSKENSVPHLNQNNLNEEPGPQ